MHGYRPELLQSHHEFCPDLDSYVQSSSARLHAGSCDHGFYRANGSAGDRSVGVERAERLLETRDTDLRGNGPSATADLRRLSISRDTWFKLWRLNVDDKRARILSGVCSSAE